VPDFDRSLPMLLNRTLDAIMPAYRELFARYRLTEQQWRILRVLWGDDEVTSVELAQRTLLTAPSLVGIIDRLEKKKLVTRVRSTSDRRQVYVVTTAQGRALEKVISPQVDAVSQHIQSTLTSAEWESLERIMDKFSAAKKRLSPHDATTAEEPL